MYQLWQEERPQPAKPKEDVDDLIFLHGCGAARERPLRPARLRAGLFPGVAKKVLTNVFECGILIEHQKQ